MRHVVVTEDPLFAFRLPHPLDHRIVVQRIGEDEAVRHQLGDGRDAGFVGHVTRSEDEGRLLAMEIGELALEIDERMIGAGDVARAAGTRAHAGRGFDHRPDHFGMLAHAEIVVGAPHDHVARSLRGVPDRARKAAGKPFEIGKDTVAAFVPEPGKGVCKIRVVIHGSLYPSAGGPFWNPPKLEAFQGACRGDNSPAARMDQSEIDADCYKLLRIAAWPAGQAGRLARYRVSENSYGLEHGLTNYGDRDFSLYLRRSFAQSMGYSRALLAKPVVGIAYTPSGFNNCHRHFPELLQAVKRGVLAAGGLPLEFPTISLGEVFLNPTSMMFRHLMSIDVEEMVRAQPMGAVVLVGGCDKTVPAQLMGAASADVPAIQLVAGPMLPTSYRNERLGACTDCRRFWAKYRAQEITTEQIGEIEGNLATTAGTCAVMGTASTMAALAE